MENPRGRDKTGCLHRCSGPAAGSLVPAEAKQGGPPGTREPEKKKCQQERNKKRRQNKRKEKGQGRQKKGKQSRTQSQGGRRKKGRKRIQIPTSYGSGTCSRKEWGKEGAGRKKRKGGGLKTGIRGCRHTCTISRACASEIFLSEMDDFMIFYDKGTIFLFFFVGDVGVSVFMTAQDDCMEWPGRANINKNNCVSKVREVKWGLRTCRTRHWC